MQDDGFITTEAALGDAMITNAGKDAMYFDLTVPAPAISVHVPSKSLGQPAAVVPMSVHERMQVMADKGMITVTTAAQRARNRPTNSIKYRVPPGLKRALYFGYISQNFQPPLGMKWKSSSGCWALVPGGG